MSEPMDFQTVDYCRSYYEVETTGQRRSQIANETEKKDLECKHKKANEDEEGKSMQIDQNGCE